MHDEDEPRVAKEWSDSIRRVKKRKQEAKVARGNSPTGKGKEESSSAFDDLNETRMMPLHRNQNRQRYSSLEAMGVGIITRQKKSKSSNGTSERKA